MTIARIPAAYAWYVDRQIAALVAEVDRDIARRAAGDPETADSIPDFVIFEDATDDMVIVSGKASESAFPAALRAVA